MEPDRHSRALFLAALLFLFASFAFAYGFAAAKYALWPSQLLTDMVWATKALASFGRVIPEHLLSRPPADAPRQRFFFYSPQRVTKGDYIFVGWSDSKRQYAAWLYSARGELLHSWPIDYRSFDPKGPPGNSDAPHGFKPLPDGSILVNFDKGAYMVRLDPCGTPIWRKRGVFHHSIERGQNGSYWAWRGLDSAYSQYQYLVNFDPTNGRTLRSISLVDDVIRKIGAESFIFGTRADFPFTRTASAASTGDSDLFHPNDIDVLTRKRAASFPEFRPGDLLISLRNVNLVAVLDGKTSRVKWWSNGPWRYQHDPDFAPDGTISVFDNNSGIGRSEIIKIDPTTRKVFNDLYQGNLRFYSESMGKHQYLPDGNVLIVVPDEGRVIETSPHGEKIFEFNNVIKDAGPFNGIVVNGIWVPEDFFSTLPSCPPPAG